MNAKTNLGFAVLVYFVLMQLVDGHTRGDAIPSTEVVTIQKCLVIEGPDWYRSVGTIDPIEAALVVGNWSRPVVGARINFGEDDDREWRQIAADESGWLRDEALKGGYAYASIDSPEKRVVILEGMAHRMVYVNGELRVGNVYQYKEEWESWEPRFNYSQIPVLLNRGRNDLLFQGGRLPAIKVLVHPVRADVMINEKDVTTPDLIVGREIDNWAAVVLINATTAPVTGLRLISRVGENKEVVREMPVLQALSVRKVAFKLAGEAPSQPGTVPLTLELTGGDASQEHGTPLYEREILLNVKHTHENHKQTFVSSIDGSVQYFSVNPAQDTEAFPTPALFLSVHGAGVEAINQSGSYSAKTWGHIVSPTNRRPYGFNWEDWGRIDALEVLDIALSTLDVDPERVYLTGHSMGGHGTWHLGALYPDRFAALGPSAGWISFWSYRPSREVVVDTPVEKMLMRTTLPSRTFDLVRNYKDLGIYILHGADDDNVLADQSRQMVARLEAFHKDFIYHEEPGVGHWWDKIDEDGTDCVDWYPMFDFFARHARPGKERVRHVEFATPNPGISAWYYWLCIEAQTKQLEMSTADVRFDPAKRQFVGRTENVARLTIDVSHVEAGDSIAIEMDGQAIIPVEYPPPPHQVTLHRKDGLWYADGPAPPSHKGPHRYGTFKDVFNHRVVFVFGTKGSEDENAWAAAKARYDAETFWYQGNGSIDVIRDVGFDPAVEPDRNVVLYGNAETNAAWRDLLGDNPVQVRSDEVRVGEKKIKGKDLGVLLIRPRPGSDTACVGVVGGTGITGMRLTDRRPYMYPGFAYPDLTLFRAVKLEYGSDAVCGLGFFGLDWSVENGEFIWDESRGNGR
ncbi:MAG: prolyl oligopeptidase family serine peptidase [Candidatus Latescibacterota bacterium]|nr:MAG: prolyl oligopeptidase family serine peptidase [Candidatus Latescibacterota bacterium]